MEEEGRDLSVAWASGEAMECSKRAAEISCAPKMWAAHDDKGFMWFVAQSELQAIGIIRLLRTYADRWDAFWHLVELGPRVTNPCLEEQP